MDQSQKVLDKVPQYASAIKTYVAAFCRRNKFALIALVRYALIALIIPWMLSVAFLPDHVREVLIGTVLLTSIIAIVRVITKRTREKEEAGLARKQNRKVQKQSQATPKQSAKSRKIDAAAAKRNQMIHYIEPSVFTQKHSSFKDEDLSNHCLVDQPAHWVVAIKLFFNPMSQRVDFTNPSLERSRSVKAAYSANKLIQIAWVLGWIVAIASVALSAFVPNLQWGSYSIATVTAIAVIVMAPWTVAWGVAAIVLWRRERFAVTDYQYSLVSMRFPFQNESTPIVGINKLLTIDPVVPPWGKILGYGHITFETLETNESITELRFVRDLTRVKVIVNHLISVRGADFSASSSKQEGE